jgi:hypothetical protein
VPEASTTSISHPFTGPFGFTQFKLALFEVIAETVNPVGVKQGESILTLSINHVSPSVPIPGWVNIFTKET